MLKTGKRNSRNPQYQCQFPQSHSLS